VLLGAAGAGWPLPVHPEEAVRRVGVLAPFVGPIAEGFIGAFRERLAQLGWSEKRNLQIHYRWDNRGGATREQAMELIALAPDVIVCQSNDAVRLLHGLNQTIPVVVSIAAGLVEMGVADSWAHPGGNITGFTLPEFSIAGKWLELLQAVAPSVRRILYLYYADSLQAQASHEYFMATLNVSASAVQVTPAPLRDVAQIADVIDAFARDPNGGLMVHPHPFTGRYRDLIVALAARYRLPATYPYRFFVECGGLISYGFDLVERWETVAGYVDMILRGVSPGELPLQGPTRIELAINLRTAKELGLAVPPRLLARADRIVE
jgi:putative tryptophan/tyrosine transport system substrate-binding protein